MLAIVDKQPKTLGLLDIMKYFIAHRKEVILRRTRFELRKAEERAHILEGLVICLDNLDAVIKLIRAAKSVDEARKGLMERFGSRSSRLRPSSRSSSSGWPSSSGSRSSRRSTRP